jgi:formate hydrogenlyase transcriptional activator
METGGCRLFRIPRIVLSIALPLFATGATAEVQAATAQFRAPTLWEEYSWYLVAATVLLAVETVLVITLLIQRRRRHHAESTMQKLYREIAEANAALTRSEAKNRAILSALPDLMFIQTLDGTYVDCYFKDVHELILPPEEWLGKNMREVLPPQLAVDFTECFDRAVQSSAPVVYEYTLPGKDKQEVRHYEARIIHYNENYILTMVRGVTERKTAESALRESETRLKLAMEAAQVGCWETDVTTGRVMRSESLERMFGVSPGSMAPDRYSYLDLVHPDDRGRIRLVAESSLRDQEITETEYRIVRPDGAIRWINARSRAVVGDDGRPRYVLGFAVDITERKQAEEDLKNALAELQRLKERVEAENVYLRSEVLGAHGQMTIMGHSEAIKKTLGQVQRVAGTDMTVLILGETGTGKELVAHSLHAESPRRDRPLVKVNCAVLPPNLIESELFGHEKGAFTGAVSKQVGRFELADGGTIFLDEVGELPLSLQAKLLRALQEGEFERLGSGKTIRVDVRVIAATNRNLLEMMQRGRFRADLYYRLNVYPIEMPPLRERTDDIELLAQVFLREAERRLGKVFDGIPEEAMAALRQYHWPGNVRELENVISRAAVTTGGKVLELPAGWKTAGDVKGENMTPALREPVCATAPAADSERTTSLDELEKTHILEVLHQTNWRIEGPQGAALLLGLHPNTLRSRMRKLDIRKPLREVNDQPGRRTGKVTVPTQ